MPDILSNDELDDLLSTVDTSPQSDTEADDEQKHRIMGYDFRRPNRLTRDHVHVLGNVNAAAAEGLSRHLSELLRASVEVNAIGIDALPYSNLISSLPTPLCMNIFAAGPANSEPEKEARPSLIEVEDRGIMTMDVPLALGIVDRLLGGPGIALEHVRPLTDLEQKVVDSPTLASLNIIAECWNHISPVDFRYIERSMDPKMLQIAPANEIMLRIIFAVGGQVGSGELIFALPFSAVDRIMPPAQLKQRAYRAPRQASDEERSTLAQRVGLADVSITALLGRTHLTLNNLASLKQDDILVLDRRVTMPLEVKVEGVDKFKAWPGRIGRNLSVQVCHVEEQRKQRQAKA